MNSLAGTKEAPRDLSRRSAESEWLDGADANPEELALVLRDLARFNGAMLGHWPVIGLVATAPPRTHRRKRRSPSSMSAVAMAICCGRSGRWARRRGLTIRLIGLDLSCARRSALRKRSPAVRNEIDYCVMDVFDFAPPVPIDFVVSSLVTHHMSDDLIVNSALDGGDRAQRLADLRSPTPPGTLLFHYPSWAS